MVRATWLPKPRLIKFTVYDHHGDPVLIEYERAPQEHPGWSPALWALELACSTRLGSGHSAALLELEQILSSGTMYRRVGGFADLNIKTPLS